MARPTDREEAKSAVLNLRVTPSLKAKLEAGARMSGRKLSAECEQRLVESMQAADRMSSPETRELLDEIEDAISQIERGSGHKWHVGVGTWAAVAEMLASGPIMAKAPRHLGERDDELMAIFQRQFEIAQQQREIEAGLDMLKDTICANDLLWSFATVDSKRELIDGSDLGEAIKAKARAVLDKATALNAENEELMAKADAILDPVADAIEQGREYYEKPQVAHVVALALHRLELRKVWKPDSPATNALAGLTRIGGMFGSGLPAKGAEGMLPAYAAPLLGGTSERENSSTVPAQDAR